jgi:succinoglycan biosynthesis transport protein ExoP
MNQRPVFLSRHQPEPRNGEAPELDMDGLIAIVRRQWRVVALCVAVFVALGIGYLLTAVPRYTARTSVLIDRGNRQVVEQLSTIGGVLDDEASVLSQVELLRSETIGLSAVDKLKLSDDPEFMAGRRSLLLAAVSDIRSILDIRRWLGGGEVRFDQIEAKRRQALANLLGNMKVSRVGRSYVLEISFTAPSPRLAAAVAGAIADAYLTDKLDAKYDATRRAGTWLQERIEELRQRSLESDLAVQRFRAANGLVTANDRLVSDQQLTELNSALIVARADTAGARARSDRIEAIIARGRERRDRHRRAGQFGHQLAARKIPGLVEAGGRDIEAARARTTPRRPAFARRWRNTTGRCSTSSGGSPGATKASWRSPGPASARSPSAVRNATDISVTAGETQVQLRELERAAETYRNLYQAFLQRYQEAVQQQSFPVTEARIISRAAPPTGASEPRLSLVLALCLALGCGVGGAVGAFREFRDRFFRTGEQVRDILGLEYLGSVPLVQPQTGSRPLTEPVKGEIYRKNELSGFATEHPSSAFAETLRSARIAADVHIDRPHKIIGIVSMLPGEGKSTIAVNFAQVLARSARTLLIDADLRNPGATRALGQHAEEGLLEVLLEGQTPASAMLIDPETGLSFLPAVVKRRTPHSSELLASAAMARLLAQMAGDFDYIVLDLPPLGPVVDARAIAPRVDGFIMVVEWGETCRKAVKDTLNAEPQIAGRCLGVILNKVDAARMKLYEGYGSPDYYASRYTQYYHETHPDPTPASIGTATRIKTAREKPDDSR